MKAVEIKEGIYWVGGIDWSLRNFHGYLTQRGSTYNSYLIIDDKITLIDNVKSYLADELIKRISQIIDPGKIDYIIQNHIEMDHSGSLPEILKRCPNATVMASPQGVQGLAKHYPMNCSIESVKSGDVIKLGKRTLHFVQTPMVHWPDNMVTYCPEEKLIFSNDAFGQHIASSERFDDEYPLSQLLHEAEKYYANIVLPFGKQVQKALDTVGTLDIETICPSHGLIWRSHIKEIIQHYVKWSHNEVDNKALIIYDTMWKSTEKIAYAIQSAFEHHNYKTRLINLQHHHISDIMTEVLAAKYICIGSPTLNNNIMPTVAGFLTYLKGLAPKGRKGLAFGSYGWSGQSVGIVENIMKESGFDMLEMVKLQYIPTEEQIESITAQISGQL
ncbi:FprA family A-type flavoprotein [bacterium]|nr:FprA family A-type flavoprotein [bacterium]